LLECGQKLVTSSCFFGLRYCDTRGKRATSGYLRSVWWWLVYFHIWKFRSIITSQLRDQQAPERLHLCRLR